MDMFDILCFNDGENLLFLRIKLVRSVIKFVEFN